VPGIVAAFTDTEAMAIITASAYLLAVTCAMALALLLQWRGQSSRLRIGLGWQFSEPAADEGQKTFG
jgi:hypothetical protein